MESPCDVFSNYLRRLKSSHFNFLNATTSRVKFDHVLFPCVLLSLFSLLFLLPLFNISPINAPCHWPDRHSSTLYLVLIPIISQKAHLIVVSSNGRSNRSSTAASPAISVFTTHAETLRLNLSSRFHLTAGKPSAEPRRHSHSSLPPRAALRAHRRRRLLLSLCAVLLAVQSHKMVCARLFRSQLAHSR